MPEFRIAQNVVSVDPSSDDTEVAPMLAAQRSAAAARSTWVSVVVNILLATVQVGVGLASKSQGLIADGIHSLSDLVSDFIVLLAGHHSKKEADEEHPYGHQRFETAASLALGVLLLVVGVGTSQSTAARMCRGGLSESTAPAPRSPSVPSSCCSHFDDYRPSHLPKPHPASNPQGDGPSQHSELAQPEPSSAPRAIRLTKTSSSDLYPSATRLKSLS
jgi:hypothetical protein